MQGKPLECKMRSAECKMQNHLSAGFAEVLAFAGFWADEME